MTVDDCIAVYEKLMGSIFGQKASRLPISITGDVVPSFDSEKVKVEISRVLSERGIPENIIFSDGSEPRCRVLVCSAIFTSIADTGLDLFALSEQKIKHLYEFGVTSKTIVSISPQPYVKRQWQLPLRPAILNLLQLALVNMLMARFVTITLS